MHFDIFERQEEIRKKSYWFLLAFIPTTVIAILLIYVALASFLMITSFYLPLLYISWSLALFISNIIFLGEPTIFSWPPFIILCTPIAVTVVFVAIRETLTIKAEGAHYLAQKLGAEIIDINPSAPKEKMLVNIVDEMSIASGIPAPTIYILQKENGINAMTAGMDPEDAILIVTKGALEVLNRDELQAVVAHEYGHIINGDCAVGSLMAGCLAGLMFIAVKGRNMMMANLEEDASRNASFWFKITFGFLIYCAGLIGKWTAEIVQAAFNRQREFLADALAVQLTRHPLSLAQALQKIGGYRYKGHIRSGAALLMNPFFIANPLNFAGLFRSHPPLEDRIYILDPSWDGDFPEFTIGHSDNKANKNMEALALVQAPFGGIDRKQCAYPELNRNWRSMPALLMLGGLNLIPLAQEKNCCFNINPQLKQTLQSDPDTIIKKIILFSEENPQSPIDRENRLPILDALEPIMRVWPEEKKQAIALFADQNLQINQNSSFLDVAVLWRINSMLGLKMQETAPDNDYMSMFRQKSAQVISIMAWLYSSCPESAQQLYDNTIKKLNQWSLPPIEDASVANAYNFHQALLLLSKSPIAIKRALIRSAAENAAEKKEIPQLEYEFLRALHMALA